jgi:hypothetical protein
MASAKPPVVSIFEPYRNDWFGVARIVVRLVKVSAFNLGLLHL